MKAVVFQVDCSTQLVEHFRHSLDVIQVGDVLNDRGGFSQERRRHDRQGGVLGAADLDRALEGFAALDGNLLQCCFLFLSFRGAEPIGSNCDVGISVFNLEVATTT